MGKLRKEEEWEEGERVMEGREERRQDHLSSNNQALN
jgi:hypothetical protein